MSNPRLKYNPKGYARLAEIVGWLVAGKNVQWRRTGEHAKMFGGHWMSFDGEMILENALRSGGLEFRVKP